MTKPLLHTDIWNKPDEWPAYYRDRFYAIEAQCIAAGMTQHQAEQCAAKDVLISNRGEYPYQPPVKGVVQKCRSRQRRGPEDRLKPHPDDVYAESGQLLRRGADQR